MEQHPVPRNISGFQFHLIGDMTLRQFGYLAAGVLTGYFIFKSAPFATIITIPLGLSFAFAGFAFAFLPIQERPLDKWLLSFIKSIMSPTQYVWSKRNPPPDILTRSLALHIQITKPQQQSAAHKETNEKLRAYLATVPVPLHESLNVAEKRYIDKTLALFQSGTVVTPSTSLPITPTTPPQHINPKPVLQPIEPVVNPPVEKKEVEQPLKEALVKDQQIKAPPPEHKPEDHVVLKDQLSQLSAEKEALEKQLQLLQQQLSNTDSSQIVKPELSREVHKEPTITVVNPKSALSDVGMLNYQQSPNLIAGVIKDPQRKLLPNIILTIKDKSGLPVRALKTNKLGQFTIATPLPNGIYLLEVEDPMKRYVFDMAQISLSGRVFQPIEIIAKGEKELIREKLTKELFGNATM